MTLKIKTNNVPREVICGIELTNKERKEFDYIKDEDFDCHSFFRYKGQVYDLNEFMRTGPGEIHDAGWQGYASDSYFSGTIIKYVDNFERVIVGTYTI
jgi:hypothetical protein